jgi:hypothetical protein
MTKDLAGSAILLVVAALYYATSTQIQVSALEDQIGPRALPAAIALLLAIVALVIGLRALIATPTPVTAEKDAEAPWPRALGILAIGALYIPVATVAGYWPALLLLLIAVPVYEGMKLSWRLAVVAAGGATFFWLVFGYVLGVQQPEGMLF